MESILYNISQVLGIAIIHSLWQGLFIYFLLKLTLTAGYKIQPSKKYLIALSAMLFTSGWFFYTMFNEIRLFSWSAPATGKLAIPYLLQQLPIVLNRTNEQPADFYYSLEKYMPYLAMVYLAGLIFNTVRLLISRKKTMLLRVGMSIDIALQKQGSNLVKMLNINKDVKIGLSKYVDVPCMTGFFKPIILLPFSLSTYLSASEIEAILLHELAHIKRNDYLVNFLQQVIATLLFFNPCVLLINKIINEERENCCDDYVLKATEQPLNYAKALYKLEQTRENQFQFALSATGNKYQLLTRIERIMKTKKSNISLRPALLAMLILCIGLGGIALFKPEIAEGKISIKSISLISNLLKSDTGKKEKAKKLATEKKHLKAKMHLSEEQGFNDAEFEKLATEVQQHGEALSQYNESPQFKKYEEDLEAKAKALENFYNNPSWKEMELKQEKLGAEFQKNRGETEETKKWTEKMSRLGENIEKYYNSTSFKELNERLEKKYGIPRDRQYFDDRTDENYKKYQEELQSHIPADIKKQTEDLKKVGEQMQNHFNSPDFRKKSEELKFWGDSLRNVFTNKDMLDQQLAMKKLSEEMRSFQNSDQIKKEQELLRLAQKKMREYLHSEAFRKNLEQMKKDQMHFYEDLEKPEKPVAPEKPDSLEKPTAPKGPAAPPAPPAGPDQKN